MIMDDRNPYAPTRASLRAGDPPREGHIGGNSAWRDDKVLVMIPDSTLPARCVKCNGPADPPTKIRKVYWHHPGVYALILINIIIYAVVGAFVRKRANVAAGLCAEHKKRRRLAITLGWVGFVTGVALLTWGFHDTAANGGVFALAGLLVALGSSVTARVLSRIVYAQRIDKNYVRLKGCAAEFLDTLPPFPG
jgi:hypothetical protein